MRLRSKNRPQGNVGSSNQGFQTESATEETPADHTASRLDYDGQASACCNTGQQPSGLIRNEMGDFHSSTDISSTDSQPSDASEPINNANLHDQSAKQALKPHNKYVIYGLQASSAVLILLYLVLPTTVRLFPCIISEIAFLNRVRWPPFVNLSQPSDVGLNFTRSFKLQTAENVEIGVWHMLPPALQESNLKDEDYTKLLSKGVPIILYFHGNAGTRGGWHRVQLYKVLIKAGFHVVSLDYRGYGDSNSSPTEDGICEDGLAVYDWIRQRSGSSPLYIWGHSMGSGVATKVASILCDRGVPLSGLFLEAPFNNIIEATTQHPFTQPFKFLPWFTWGFVEAMKYNNIYFSSDISISRVTVPTLILHAKDDGIVPYTLGRKLYTTALATKTKGKVEMVSFDAEHGYGHKHIHKAPELPGIVRDFIERVGTN